MNLVTGKQLADIIGVAPAQVYRASTLGRVKYTIVDGVKMYDADTQVDAYWSNRTEGTIRNDFKETSKPADVPMLTAEQINDALTSNLLSISDADRLKKTYEGKLAKLKFETEEGKLVAIDEVAKVVENEYALVRARFRSISSKLAPLVALEDSEKRCRALIEQAVEDCLKELSSYGE
jgi:hypothetical protein